MATKEINHQSEVISALKKDNAELTKLNQELMKKMGLITTLLV